MFEKYLINLYKNLSLYNTPLTNFTIHSHKMVGGAEPSESAKQIIKIFDQIFATLKTEIAALKSRPTLDTNELNKQLRIFFVITDVYHLYLTELMKQHTKLGTELTELNDLINVNVVHDMTDAAKLLSELLGNMATDSV